MKKLLFILAAAIAVSSCYQTTEVFPVTPFVLVQFGVRHQFVNPSGTDSITESLHYMTNIDSIVSIEVNSVPVKPTSDTMASRFLNGSLFHVNGTPDTLTITFQHSTLSTPFTIDQPGPILRSPALGSVLQRSAPFAFTVDSIPWNSFVTLSDNAGKSDEYLDTSGTISLPNLTAYQGPTLHVDAKEAGVVFAPIYDNGLKIDAGIGTELLVNYELK